MLKPTHSFAMNVWSRYHYHWLLTTCDSWWPRSASWGTGLLNDNVRQWNVLRATTHRLLNQESLMWQPGRQVRWIRIPAIHPVQIKLSNPSLMTRRKTGTPSPSHPEKAQAVALIPGNNELHPQECERSHSKQPLWFDPHCEIIKQILKSA